MEFLGVGGVARGALRFVFKDNTNQPIATSSSGARAFGGPTFACPPRGLSRRRLSTESSSRIGKSEAPLASEEGPQSRREGDLSQIEKLFRGKGNRIDPEFRSEIVLGHHIIHLEQI